MVKLRQNFKYEELYKNFLFCCLPRHMLKISLEGFRMNLYVNQRTQIKGKLQNVNLKSLLVVYFAECRV